MEGCKVLYGCRTCLRVIRDSNKNYLDINSTCPTSNMIPLKEKLANCIPEVYLDEKDMILCFSCIEKLTLAYQFKQRCLESQQKIYSFLQQVPADSQTDISTIPMSTIAMYYQGLEDLADGVDPTLADSPSKNTKCVKMPYNCIRCPFSCQDKCVIRHHEILHRTKDPPYKCDECSFIFPTAELLLEHLAAHTNELPYSCTICDFVTSSHNELKEHGWIHRKLFQCNICWNRYANRSELDNHMEIHNYEQEARRFQCGWCEYKCDNLNSLICHLDYKHQNTYKCKKCSVICRTHLGLMQHKMMAHTEAPKEVDIYEDLNNDLNKDIIIVSDDEYENTNPKNLQQRDVVSKRGCVCENCSGTFNTRDKLAKYCNRCVSNSGPSQNQGIRPNPTSTSENLSSVCYGSVLDANSKTDLLFEAVGRADNSSDKRVSRSPPRRHSPPTNEHRSPLVSAMTFSHKDAWQKSISTLCMSKQAADRNVKDQFYGMNETKRTDVIIKATGNTQNRFKCELCTFTGKNRISVKSHRKRKHRNAAANYQGFSVSENCGANLNLNLNPNFQLNSSEFQNIFSGSFQVAELANFQDTNLEENVDINVRLTCLPQNIQGILESNINNSTNIEVIDFTEDVDTGVNVQDCSKHESVEILQVTNVRGDMETRHELRYQYQKQNSSSNVENMKRKYGKLWQCKFCPDSFEKRTSYRNHFKTTHKQYLKVDWVTPGQSNNNKNGTVDVQHNTNVLPLTSAGENNGINTEVTKLPTNTNAVVHQNLNVNCQNTQEQGNLESSIVQVTEAGGNIELNNQTINLSQNTDPTDTEQNVIDLTKNTDTGISVQHRSNQETVEILQVTNIRGDVETKHELSNQNHEQNSSINVESEITQDMEGKPAKLWQCKFCPDSFEKRTHYRHHFKKTHKQYTKADSLTLGQCNNNENVNLGVQQKTNALPLISAGENSGINTEVTELPSNMDINAGLHENLNVNHMNTQEQQNLESTIFQITEAGGNIESNDQTINLPQNTDPINTKQNVNMNIQNTVTSEIFQNLQRTSQDHLGTPYHRKGAPKHVHKTNLKAPSNESNEGESLQVKNQPLITNLQATNITQDIETNIHTTNPSQNMGVTCKNNDQGTKVPENLCSNIQTTNELKNIFIRQLRKFNLENNPDKCASGNSETEANTNLNINIQPTSAIENLNKSNPVGKKVSKVEENYGKVLKLDENQVVVVNMNEQAPNENTVLNIQENAANIQVCDVTDNKNVELDKTSKPKRVVKCGKCSVECENREMANIHCKLVHSKSENSKSSDQRSNTDVEEKGLDPKNRKQLEINKNAPQPKKLYKCLLCPFVCESKNGRRKHNKRVHRLAQTNFEASNTSSALKSSVSDPSLHKTKIKKEKRSSLYIIREKLLRRHIKSVDNMVLRLEETNLEDSNTVSKLECTYKNENSAATAVVGEENILINKSVAVKRKNSDTAIVAVKREKLDIDDDNINITDLLQHPNVTNRNATDTINDCANPSTSNVKVKQDNLDMEVAADQHKSIAAAVDIKKDILETTDPNIQAITVPQNVDGGREGFQCPFCKQKPKRYNHLCNHVRIKHRNSKFEINTNELEPKYFYECPLCQFECESRSETRKHTTVHRLGQTKLEAGTHNNDNTEPHNLNIDVQPNTAEENLNSNVSQMTPMDLNRSKTQNLDEVEKCNRCPWCSAKYRLYRSLRQHIRLVHKRSVKELTSIIFKNKHKRIFKCSLCAFNCITKKQKDFHFSKVHILGRKYLETLNSASELECSVSDPHIRITDTHQKLDDMDTNVEDGKNNVATCKDENTASTSVVIDEENIFVNKSVAAKCKNPDATTVAVKHEQLDINDGENINDLHKNLDLTVIDVKQKNLTASDVINDSSNPSTSNVKVKQENLDVEVATHQHESTTTTLDIKKEISETADTNNDDKNLDMGIVSAKPKF